MGGERRQHGGPGASARRRGAEKGGGAEPVEADPNPAPDEAIGRSRGGLTTKLHLACDGKGRPLSVVLTPGQRHDSTQLEAVLAGIRVPRLGRGRPRTRPDHLIADKGYSYERCRALLRGRDIAHTIPERSDQRARRAHRPGRKPGFDRAVYRRRNVVERCVNRLKQWRGIANRYEKRAANFRAMVVLASLMIWLGSYSSDTP